MLNAANEGLKDFESAAWSGFLGPKGALKGAIDRLKKEILAAADPAMRSRFTEFGADPIGSTREELGRCISAEIVRWREIISRGGITLE